jgi:hypothetical protein
MGVLPALPGLPAPPVELGVLAVSKPQPTSGNAAKHIRVKVRRIGM